MSTTVAERAWCVVVPHHARGAHVARHRLAHELDALELRQHRAQALARERFVVGDQDLHGRGMLKRQR